jgi:glycosyltransferase involved in cell wall biosynthesis
MLSIAFMKQGTYMNNNKWIIVAGDMPYPPNTGGRASVYNKIVALKKLGININLICTVRNEPEKKDVQHLKSIVSNLYIFKRDLTVKNIIHPWKPFQITSRQTVLKQLGRICDEYIKYRYLPSCVFAEGLYVADIAVALSKRLGIRCILRSHNLESKYFFELGKSAPLLKKTYYLFEAAKLYLYERSVTKNFSLILSISEDEIPGLKELAPASDVRWLPPFISIPDDKASREKEKTILFLAALQMPNNAFGLRWFVENVWKQIQKDSPGKVRFLVVGRGPTEYVKRLCENNSIELHADVPDIAPYYDAASVVINPVFHGTGVNIKTIEAVVYGKPLVTTIKGIRGTGLDAKTHVLVADSPGEFQRAVLSIIDAPESAAKMASEARDYIIKYYNYEARLLELISSIKSEPPQAWK